MNYILKGIFFFFFLANIRKTQKTACYFPYSNHEKAYQKVQKYTWKKTWGGGKHEWVDGERLSHDDNWVTYTTVNGVSFELRAKGRERWPWLSHLFSLSLNTPFVKHRNWDPSRGCLKDWMEKKAKMKKVLVHCLASGSGVKNLPAMQETQEIWVQSHIRGSGRSPGGGNGSPLQCSCLGNPTDRGAWRATVHGVTKSWTWLSTSYLMVSCTQ